MNTAVSTRAIAMIGPVTSSMALSGAASAGQAVLDVVLDVLHDHDGVVDDDADRQHQAEEREVVEREAQRRHHGERADDAHRNVDQRQERGPPGLEEEDDHDRDEDARPRSSV